MSTGKNLDWRKSSHQAFKKAKTISITGGKGGVGKTSVALKLSKTLASTGRKVLLIDCDYNLSNTAVKLGISLSDNFRGFVSGEKKFEECIYTDGNLDLLSACNGNLELFDHGTDIEKIILDVIYTREQYYDYIFLDCPAGLNRETLTLNAYSDERIIVVVPDKSSITDSYSLIKILNNRYGVKDNFLLVNRVSSQEQFLRLIKTMSDTIEKYLNFSIKILGNLRNEVSSSDQFDKILLGEENDLHKDFCKIVQKLTEDDRHEGQFDKPFVKKESRSRLLSRTLNKELRPQL